MPPTTEGRGDGETRLITVMFADLTGSVAATYGQEAEETADLLGAVQDVMVDAVERRGGSVHQLLGDGVLAVFGAEQTREDDAERAIAAALAIRAALAERGLRGTVGLASGEVFVTEATVGALQTPRIAGTTVNLAARFQSAAAPGEVVVADATYRLASRAFVFEPRQITVKGAPSPLAVHAVLAPRSQRLPVPTDTPLCGRGAALAALLTAVEANRSGRGGMVILRGEPGIGKSRLLREALASTDPAIVWLETYCAEGDDDSRLGAFARLPVYTMADRSVPAVIAGDRVTGVSPRDLSAAATRAVVDSLVTRVGSTPTVVVIEDIHWIDPVSLAVCEALAEPITATSLTLLLTTRRDGQAAERIATAAARSGRPATTIDLLPLPDPAAAMLVSLLADADGKETIASSVLERAQGNPLFIEELVRAGDRAGVIGGDPGETADAPAVPVAIHSIVASRLDRLDEDARSVAEAAAVLGTSFDATVLANMLEHDPAAALATLADQLILLPAPLDSSGTRRFVHAVTRDTVYRRLSRRRRRDLHARALSVLTARGAPVETLARHCEIAGPDDVAAGLLESAGERAQAAFQNATAARWFARARACLERSGGSPRALGRVDEARGESLRLAGRFDEAIVALDDALRQAGDPTVRARLERRRAAVLRDAGRLEECGEALDRAEVALDEGGERSLDERCAVAVERGWQLYFAGRVPDLDRWTQSTRLLVAERGAPDQIASYQQVQTLAALTQNRFRPDRATLDLAQVAAASAERVGDAFTIASATFNLAFALLWHGELDAAEEQLARALEAAARCDDVPIRLRALTYRAVVSRLLQDVDACRASVAVSLDAAKRHSAPHYVAVALACRGWCALRIGELDAARTDIEEVVASYARPGPPFPFEWLARWPAIALDLGAENFAGATAHAAMLRSPSQQASPPELDGALVIATPDALRDALPRARSLGYV